METNRKKWPTLKGINLYDGQTYQISMRGSARRWKVVPDSFRIILNQYPRKPEVKSLGWDGTNCTAKTQGMLCRMQIVARQIIPVGKETDRRWEQREDPSMLEPGSHTFESQGKMCVAGPSERKRWSKMVVTELIRESGLSPTTVYKILEGEPVRCYILSNFRQAFDKIAV